MLSAVGCSPLIKVFGPRVLDVYGTECVACLSHFAFTA
ncbi:hypothetical protein CGRA01v4_14558 [Colletotrichum graminicola]|nr:hypothetical protein CGRA01v4_14558 [Colletotrichum graminicola]